jgi:hypothetical protein
MKVWPFVVGLPELAANRLLLHWLMTVVVSEQVKRLQVKGSGGDQEDVALNALIGGGLPVGEALCEAS